MEVKRRKTLNSAWNRDARPRPCYTPTSPTPSPTPLGFSKPVAHRDLLGMRGWAHLGNHLLCFLWLAVCLVGILRCWCRWFWAQMAKVDLHPGTTIRNASRWGTNTGFDIETRPTLPPSLTRILDGKMPPIGRELFGRIYCIAIKSWKKIRYSGWNDQSKVSMSSAVPNYPYPAKIALESSWEWRQGSGSVVNNVQ